MTQRIYETKIVDYVVIHCCQIRQRLFLEKVLEDSSLDAFYQEVFQNSLMDVFLPKTAVAKFVNVCSRSVLLKGLRNS